MKATQLLQMLSRWTNSSAACSLESSVLHGITVLGERQMPTHCICVCSSIVWFVHHEVCTAGALKNEIDVAHTIAIVALHLRVDVIHRHDLCAT